MEVATVNVLMHRKRCPQIVVPSPLRSAGSPSDEGGLLGEMVPTGTPLSSWLATVPFDSTFLSRKLVPLFFLQNREGQGLVKRFLFVFQFYFSILNRARSLLCLFLVFAKF